jgi:hypothetical protein
MNARISFQTSVFRASILAYLAVGLSGLSAAANFVTVDVPGASNTVITAINANGDVTGYYYGPNNITHVGFVRTADGTITTFGPPANTIFTDINPYAINASGVTTGSISSNQGCGSNPQCAQAFVRTADGTITVFNVNQTITITSSINSSGDVTGSYGYSGSTGFIRTSDGIITTFGAIPTGVNDSGETTGAFDGDGDAGTIGFVRTAGGQITTFSAEEPQWWAIVGRGINNSGLVVGTSQNLICEVSGFKRCGIFEIQGFLRQPGGLITTFNAFGNSETVPVGINAGGDVVGYFGIQLVGFVRDRSGLITAFQPPNSVDTFPAGINDAGVVAGWFSDSQSNGHGFIRFP